MKKVLLFMFVLLSFSVYTNAQTTLFTEEFDYTAGDALLNHGWTLSGSTTTNALTIASAGLTYSGVTSVGNALGMADYGMDVYNSYTTTSSGSVYLSFLINVTSAGTGDYFIALSPSSSQTNYYARMHVKSSGSGYVVGISKSNEASGGASYGSTVLSFGTTYLIVVKYEFVSAGTADDMISVFAFASGTFPAAEPTTAEVLNYAYSSKDDPADLQYITLRQGTSGSAAVLTIDAIHIYTTWSQVAVGVQKDLSANSIPTDFVLNQNYPNPFNPTTKITFSVPVSGFYTVKVYDILGKEVSTLVAEELSAGPYSVSFNAKNLASGTYVYRLIGNNVALSQKMLLVK